MRAKSKSFIAGPIPTQNKHYKLWKRKYGIQSDFPKWISLWREEDWPNLGRNTANIKAGAPKSASLLDAGGLEPQLGRLDRCHVAAGAASDHDDVVLIRSRREAPGERGQRVGVPESIGAAAGEVSGQKVSLPPRDARHRHRHRRRSSVGHEHWLTLEGKNKRTSSTKGGEAKAGFAWPSIPFGFLIRGPCP